MTVEITPQLLITAGAVLTAGTAIITALFKLFRWFERQKMQDTELKAQDAKIDELEKKHKEDIKTLKQLEAADIAEIKKELQLLTYGNLACLKGLQEKGCNGPVTEAINTFEKHLNRKAHE